MPFTILVLQHLLSLNSTHPYQTQLLDVAAECRARQILDQFSQQMQWHFELGITPASPENLPV